VSQKQNVTPVSLTATRAQIVEIATLVQEADDYIAASLSEATLRSYRTGWEQFTAWAEAHGWASLPASPDTVALFVTDLAKTVKPATIDSRLAGIAAAHRAAGYESPTTSERVRLVRRGVRRTVGVAQRAVRPVVVSDLLKMVECLGDDLAGRRDRALLLIGFAAALRRSELVGLDAKDLTETPEGLVVNISRSKTDQEAAGRKIGIPFGSNPATCPVRAWRAWTEVAGVEEGPLFRPIDRHGRVGERRLTGQSVAAIVKTHAEQVGIDPKQVAGHSLRAGLATAAAAAGVNERDIAATTGHRGTAMLRRYIRDGSLFRENAAAATGL
jgi:site-specific recombinase XerD